MKVSDFESRKGDLDAKKAQIAALKLKHAKLQAYVDKARNIEWSQQMTRGGTASSYGGTRWSHVRILGLQGN